MKKIYLSLFAVIFISMLSKAQVNIKVVAYQVSVVSSLNCDGGADNSDFLFEFKATDNSHFSYSNNTPVPGSIGNCNYIYIPEDNGPYTVNTTTPGGATFNPSDGVFFNSNYSCKQDIPTELTITWTAYENDDSSIPSTTPVADGQIAAQTSTFSIPTASGTYTMQYTATSTDGGCPQTYEIVFGVVRSTGSFSPLIIGGIAGHTICTGASDGEVESAVVGGSGTVLYDWSYDGTNDFDDNATETGLTGGTYTLVVKDGLGCTDTAVAVVAEQNPPTAISFSTPSPTTICTGSYNTYSVTAQSGVVYNWTFTGGSYIVVTNTANEATLTAQSGATSGTLSVTAQNTCSMSPTITLDITALQSPSLTISGNNLVCDNAQTTLTVSGASTYTWSTGDQTATVNIGPGDATYTVSGTDNATGCFGETTFNITTLTSPTFAINGSTASVCPAQTVSLSVSGNGTNYIWSDGYIGTSHGISAAATMIYTVTATYTNSCFSQKTYTLDVYPTPTITVSGNLMACMGTTTTLTATGADTYSWSSGSTTDTETLTISGQDTYTITGTNTITTCHSSTVVTVDMYSQPVLSVNGNTTLCAGDQTILTASGSDFYSWSTGGTASTESITATTTMTVKVVGTNAGFNGGCKDSTSIILNVTPTPSLSVSGTDSICEGQTTLLMVSGASTYTWSTGDNSSSIVVSPTVTTTYTVSSINGSCGDTKTHVVNVNPKPVIDFILGGNICENDNPLTLNATPSGGTYSGAGITGNTFDPSVAGAGLQIITYSVTNSHGCSDNTQASITVRTCAGIHEYNQNLQILVFPNPSQGIITIQTETTMKEIQVMNVSGQLVDLLQTHSTEEKMDISLLKSGIYFLNIRFENGQNAHYKIMKH